MLDQTLLDLQQPYLVACSGGQDSVALVHLLYTEGFQKLELIHINHQLRGEESSADAAFVGELAASFSLPFHLAQVDVTALAKNEQLSIETAARQARHHFFAETAQKTGIDTILLAHHADDQAETCLFNLLRGSASLRGMRKSNTITVSETTFTLLRPLLSTRRKELTNYLTAHGYPHREDSSNATLDYTRNRIRNQALPLLNEILDRDVTPSLLRALAAAQTQTKIVDDYLENLQLLDPQGRIHLPTLRELSQETQGAAIAKYLKAQKVGNISQEMISQVLALLNTEGPSVLNLPGNRFIRRRQGRLFIDEN